MAKAAKVVNISTKQVAPEKNPAAVALGRLGGLKGGNARAAALSPADRKAIAQRAAKQRWAKVKSNESGNSVDLAVDSSRAAKLA